MTTGKQLSMLKFARMRQMNYLWRIITLIMENDIVLGFGLFFTYVTVLFFIWAYVKDK
jgi:hypothetical protein